jgi:hypothetical protein
MILLFDFKILANWNSRKDELLPKKISQSLSQLIWFLNKTNIYCSLRIKWLGVDEDDHIPNKNSSLVLLPGIF